MHFVFNNVNDAFSNMVKGIHEGTIPTIITPSRVGEILQITEPVIMTYNNPQHRVLFNQARDCNPFFHLYEALWMLAGRNDIAPLSYYSSGYGKQVDDGNGLANGAYGYRWRHSHNKPEGSRTHGEFDGTDQLDLVIDQLKRKPESRRVVLQMWNVNDDLLKMDTSKDICCNLSVLFNISNLDLGHEHRQLNMTVFNRSNDLIWGALGANFVHFSFLQEYVANCLGVAMGQYHQISNNLHAYTERWFPSEWLSDDLSKVEMSSTSNDLSLVTDRETFDREVREFVTFNGAVKSKGYLVPLWEETFLDTIAQPMMNAFHLHKLREYWAASNWIDRVHSFDWRFAGRLWLEKREQMWKDKQNGE